jgi:hypothetical protein
MSDCTVIETQEQLDAVLKDRLNRERESSAKKYEGYTSPDDLQKLKDSYEAKIKALEDAAQTTQQTLDQKDAQIADGEKYRTDLEKTRIAINAGLDIKYADRLRGESAEEWKKDAEELAKDFAIAHQAAPLGSNEPQITEEQSSKKAFQNWVNENL